MSSNSISTLALLAASCCTTSAVAEVGGSSSPSSSCLNLTATFPAPLQGTECWGLAHTPTGPLGNPIKSADECGSACCASTTCTVYNFKAPIGPTTGCWTGTGPMSKMQCKPVGGWVGRGGRGQPPPPPPPPPCPQSAGSLALCQLPAAPSVSPLPFSPEPSVATAPDGTTFGADSKSLLLNSSRYYPVSGEVHLARLPAEQWVEQLMRMKAGGLDMIAVYVFWIHHEEKQGMFDFTGRRDVRRFVSIAKSVGLKILMRIGPWDHGECRNGGHPDWVLTSCGRVRSTDPKYLACVEGWYAALGAELKGYYHKDGGPIVITQVDNETPNWKFLLALRQLGLKHGIEPTFYSKTGWPSPGPGYPADYPMLPYFGGYADLFWTSAMTAQPSSGMYAFAGDKAGNAPSQVPAGYPYLGVEIGGGMAAAYNHRTHMFSEDMPSMHLVDVADSFNGLGYYMYHGGNNPHSTIWTHNRDAPNTTLQESSFQPAGPANPMPSESYDFFAPLGEFGQPRRHYHQMRRLHNMIQGWGTLLASTAQTLPVIMPSAWNDNTTVRWSVRTDNNSAGFLFVNNYQRLFPLPIHTGVRFSIMGRDGSTLTVPSAKSPPVSVLSGAWFAWPLNIPLLPEASSATKPKIAWATAQLAARVDAAGLGSATTETIFLLQIDGATPEVALANVASSALTVAAGKATATHEGEHTVLRGIATGTSEFASVKVGQSTVVLVLLPWEMRDRVWVHDTLERPTVLISEPMDSDSPVAEESERYGALLLAGNDSTTLHVRSECNTTSFWICPHHSSLGEADGVFTKHTMSMTQVAIPTPAVQLTKPAAPPRKVVIAPSHKAQEPTAEEWAAAAEYTLTLSLPEGWEQHGKQTTELTLAIDYSGDAARIYYNDRLLTDNWYSGYRGEGAMEVGLTYLAGENPGLLTDGAELTLLILPLKRSTIDGTADPELEGQVFIQQSYWPEFGGNESVLDLHGLSWVQTAHIPLSIY